MILTWLPELRHDQQPYKEYVREDFSFGNRAMSKGNESILLDKEGPNLSKFRSSSTAELHPKSHDEKHKQMLFASVMNRIIPIIVWKKLFRNPHTYSSVIGLIWALISFRYATFYYAMSIKSVLVSISFQTAHMDFLYDHCRWHVDMPRIVAKSIAILSVAGLDMAMFSLGMPFPGNLCYFLVVLPFFLRG